MAWIERRRDDYAVEYCRGIRGLALPYFRSWHCAGELHELRCRRAKERGRRGRAGEKREGEAAKETERRRCLCPEL
jgi:hypothetical protein